MSLSSSSLKKLITILNYLHASNTWSSVTQMLDVASKNVHDNEIAVHSKGCLEEITFQ